MRPVFPVLTLGWEVFCGGRSRLLIWGRRGLMFHEAGEDEIERGNAFGGVDATASCPHREQRHERRTAKPFPIPYHWRAL